MVNMEKIRGKWLPRRGQCFKSRDELEEKLLSSGWEFEGRGTSLDEGVPTSYNIGVQDEKRKVWILVDMEPVMRVTRVKRRKLK